MAEPDRTRVAEWLLVPGWGFAASAFDEVRAALPGSLRTEAVACRDALAAIGRRVAAVQAGEASQVDHSASVAGPNGVPYACRTGRGEPALSA